MKNFAILLLVAVLAPQCFATCVKSYPNPCTYVNTGTGYASFPLCFRNGWPAGCPVPACGCYAPTMAGCHNNPNIPCLPPIINGRLIPPCVGQFIVVQQSHIANTYY